MNDNPGASGDLIRPDALVRVIEVTKRYQGGGPVPAPPGGDNLPVLQPAEGPDRG